MATAPHLSGLDEDELKREKEIAQILKIEQQTRIIAADAERKEKSLVPVEDVEFILADIAARQSSGLSMLASRVSSDLARITDAAEIQRILRREIANALGDVRAEALAFLLEGE